MWLVSRLGIEHVLGLVKLVLLEGRILLFSCRASMASCAVLALLTLIPGLYNQVRRAGVDMTLVYWGWTGWGRWWESV